MGLLNLKVPSREDFRSERIVLREESSNSADPRFWNFSCMRGKRSGRIFKSVVKHSTAVLLSVGPERMRWNTRPATATKLGFPGVGNACDDSIEAKEKIRFNFRDSFGVSGERRKTSNSGGGWGRRWTAERRLPSWPQQNPGFSPVRSSMRHLGHRLSAARLFEDEPQVKRGVKIGLITQVSDLVYVRFCNVYWRAWYYDKNIYVLTQKTGPQDPERFAGGAYRDTTIYSIEVVVSLLSSL